MRRQQMREPDSTSRTAPLPNPPLRGGKLVLQARVFISYRRQDTGPAAEHLHASLAGRLGSERVFRDVATIQPGQDYGAVIDQAIRATSVFIPLIGRRWLTVRGPKGLRRLDDPKDLLRQEIESALRQGVSVIPVLVDGAKMPAADELPPSIADLATRNAYELPWQEGIDKLGRRIAEIERERAERYTTERGEYERLDLTRGLQTVSPSHSVTKAMEISLAHQGHFVPLDPKDWASCMKKFTGRPVDQGLSLAIWCT